MGADADEPGPTVTVTHPDTTRLNLLEDRKLDLILVEDDKWKVVPQGSRPSNHPPFTTVRAAIDQHLQ